MNAQTSCFTLPSPSCSRRTTWRLRSSPACSEPCSPHRLDYADLYFQYSRSEGWSLEEGIVKSGSFNIDQGVGVRAISGEKTAFAYSDEISLPALRDAAQTTRAIAHSGAQSGSQTAVRVRGKSALARRASGRDLYRPEDPLSSLPDGAKVKLLEQTRANVPRDGSRASCR